MIDSTECGLMPQGCGTRKIAVLLVQYLAETSGSWQVLRNLMERLDPGQFRTVLVLPARRKMSGAVPAHVLVRYATIPRLRAKVGLGAHARVLGQGLASIVQLRRIIREEAIDIVHCNSLPNLFPALAAVSARVPLVWHVHELEFRPRFVFLGLCWLCRLFADRIVCVSFEVENLFGGSAKAVVIHNGVDLERFYMDRAPTRADSLQRLGLPPESFIVTQLGRIVPIKGVERFIELAEAFVAKKLPGFRSVRFVLVGGPIAGHEEYFNAMLDRIHSSPVRNQLIYVPTMDDPWEALAVTNVLVQSSVIAESFGLSLVEAMAMGKPVIASRAGGPAEIIRDGIDGFLVSPHDVERRADILTELFVDRVRLEHLGANALKRAQDAFSADRMARGFCALYRSLCPSSVEADSCTR
ncbi:MAG: glycosyltransferase family 4 protein [Candidatus Methylomirabilales bacterium]